MNKSFHIETGTGQIAAGESTADVTFSRTYALPPTVMITPVRSNSNPSIPNIYLSNVTITQMTVKSSQPLSGDLTINYIAIKATPKTL